MRDGRHRDRPSLRGLLTRLVAVLAFVLAVLIGAAVLGTVVTARDYRDAAQLALDRQTAANQLLVDLLNAETGNRGYTLTGRGDYLEPYTTARDRYEDDLARLRALVRGQSALEERVDRVDGLAQLWFTEASELIRLRRQGRVDDAVERINQGIAKLRIDAFRSAYADLALQVQETRRRSFEQADGRRDITLAAVVIAAVLALAVVLGTSRRLWTRVGLPINLVAAGVSRMARGRFTDPVPSGDDAVRELADLTDGFNTMQRQVFQQRDAVAAAARREAAQRTERRLWETVQHGLLPSTLPGYPGYRLVARYRPAERALLVGGDFYDAEVLSDGRLAVIVGDMAGHGAPAAAQAAGLRFGWRTMVAVDPDPARVLAALNAQMARHELRQEGLFATVIYALVEPGGGGVFACGGHPAPLMLRADGCRPLEPIGSGPLLGVMDEAEWPLTPFTLGAGETLVLYTDGLIEARRGDEQFGTERACAMLDAERAAAVEARVERLVDAARRHDDGSLRDDVVVLALEHVRAAAAATP
jgi:sigma-B regulation protein RsbU (phosphoserine phosphatase)